MLFFFFLTEYSFIFIFRFIVFFSPPLNTLKVFVFRRVTWSFCSCKSDTFPTVGRRFCNFCYLWPNVFEWQLSDPDKFWPYVQHTRSPFSYSHLHWWQKSGKRGCYIPESMDFYKRNYCVLCLNWINSVKIKSNSHICIKMPINSKAPFYLDQR